MSVERCTLQLPNGRTLALLSNYHCSKWKIFAKELKVMIVITVSEWCCASGSRSPMSMTNMVLPLGGCWSKLWVIHLEETIVLWQRPQQTSIQVCTCKDSQLVVMECKLMFQQDRLVTRQIIDHCGVSLSEVQCLPHRWQTKHYQTYVQPHIKL